MLQKEKHASRGVSPYYWLLTYYLLGRHPSFCHRVDYLFLSIGDASTVWLSCPKRRKRKSWLARRRMWQQVPPKWVNNKSGTVSMSLFLGWKALTSFDEVCSDVPEPLSLFQCLRRKLKWGFKRKICKIRRYEGAKWSFLRRE